MNCWLSKKDSVRRRYSVNPQSFGNSCKSYIQKWCPKTFYACIANTYSKHCTLRVLKKTANLLAAVLTLGYYTNEIFRSHERINWNTIHVKAQSRPLVSNKTYYKACHSIHQPSVSLDINSRSSFQLSTLISKLRWRVEAEIRKKTRIKRWSKAKKKVSGEECEENETGGRGDWRFVLIKTLGVRGNPHYHPPPFWRYNPST